MTAFGFGLRWRNWVAALLSSVTSRILLNGRPGAPIVHRRGVRQGDSLSPMLFIIAMEILARLFQTARDQGIVRPLDTPAIKHHCSLYADDVILFIQPYAREATAIKTILSSFGEASGSQTNLTKCSITPIHDADGSLPQLQAILGCRISEFSIDYLGLLLSSKKISKARIQAIVDAVAKRLPVCHGPLMAKSGRLVWIKSVLAAIPIYALIADGLPPWAQKEIAGICRRFLWTGKEGSIHGKCMVAWPTVCRPKELGGLGIPDINLSGIALQTRWLWLQQTDGQRAWAQLPLAASQEVSAFFVASTYTIIGNGRSTSFWTGRWLQGRAITDIAPTLTALVHRRNIPRTTVAAALQDRSWVTQITGGITVPDIHEYLDLWDQLQ